eukprot:TRINITY_DN2884_c0_g1_i2.p1 TRINITY_DN2884_c0_g1~~TRINITY_DN2884_c0_g1_i2.p1  ORF type:complete len:195 (-),score=44.79 TRINITY_DN2884_c0_g1_i2:1223-1807(-)
MGLAGRVALITCVTVLMVVILLALYSVEIAFSIKYVSPKESMVTYGRDMLDAVLWGDEEPTYIPPSERIAYNRSLGLVPFYMVSLEGSGRRPEMSEFIRQSQFKMEFFSAVYGSKVAWNDTFFLNKTGQHFAMLEDGTRVHYDADLCLEKYDRFLTFGEIGCALSHFKLYKKCVDENIPMMFIIEDDVRCGLAS